MTPEKVFAILLILFLAIWGVAELLNWGINALHRRRVDKLLHIPHQHKGF